jgi:hypothetical protein
MVEKSPALYRRLRLDVIREKLREADLDIVADLDDERLADVRSLVRNLPHPAPTDEAG